MISHKIRMLGLAAAVVLPAGLATPAFADQDDGWFWGRGMMGQWFRGEMMGRGMMDGWGPGMMMGQRFSEQRLAALKTELGITEAQTKAWDDYATAIKASAQSMRDAHVRLMGTADPATLPERLQLSQEMMAARIESMKSANAATLALYEALNDEQKKKADELILGMGMM
jgi:hypothetical protein